MDHESGNLYSTEAYLVLPPMDALNGAGEEFHLLHWRNERRAGLLVHLQQTAGFTMKVLYSIRSQGAVA